MNKPSKKIAIKGNASYHFDYISKKVSWKSFLDWVSETIPRDAKDVSLELMQHKYKDDGDEVWLEFTWHKKIKNKNFDKQTKKYKKDLTRSRNEKENETKH